MERLCYYEADVERIVRLTTEFLAGTIAADIPAFLDRLKSLLEAECTALVHVETKRGEPVFELFGIKGGRRGHAQWQRPLSRLCQLEHGNEDARVSATADVLISMLPSRSRCATAIVAILPGKRVGPKELASLRLIHSLARPRLDRLLSEIRRAEPVAPRVQQVHQGLLNGLSEKQIAAWLHISPHTVHVYVKSLFRLHNVHSRGELLSAALRSRAASVGRQPPLPRHHNQIPRRKLEKADKNIATPLPVAPVLRAEEDVLLRTFQPAGQRANAPPDFQFAAMGIESDHH